MRLFFTTRKAVLTVAIATTFSLTACQTPAATPPSPVENTTIKAPAENALIQRELGDGLYEMAYSPAADVLYVASAQRFNNVNGGILYRLDPRTLRTLGETHTDLKNFGMSVNKSGSRIYTTNTLDGGISEIDAQSGKVLQRLMFGGKDKDGDPVGAREILSHGNELYVGAVADPGFISVADARTFRLKTRISNAGKWVTGIIYSPFTDKIYAANGGGEILVINPHSHKTEQRLTPGDGKQYLFLNMAEDPATGRLFVTDDSKAKTTLVFDERSGKVIKRIEGDALGIKFNPVRNELYISQRQSKKVLVLDAATYVVKRSWSFDTHPNSLLVSANGQALYVTLKQDVSKDLSVKGPDSIVRINLNG